MAGAAAGGGRARRAAALAGGRAGLCRHDGRDRAGDGVSVRRRVRGALRALETAGADLHGLSDHAGRGARTGAVPPALPCGITERAPARRDTARAAADHRAITGTDGRLRKLRGALGARGENAAGTADARARQPARHAAGGRGLQARLRAQPDAGVHRPDALLRTSARRAARLPLRAAGAAQLHRRGARRLPPAAGGKTLPGRAPACGRDSVFRPARAVLPARAGREQQREVCARCAGADLFPGKRRHGDRPVHPRQRPGRARVRPAVCV